MFGVEGVNCPAESPDFNPIECLWHEMKEFLHREIKPTSQSELVKGIEMFWQNYLDTARCQKYILHLKKVLPNIVEQNGGPAGY